MRIVFLALTVPLFLAACAPTSVQDTSVPDQVRPLRQCFNISQVSNFRQGRTNEIYLRVGRNDVYRLDAAGGCNDLDFANQLAIVSDFGGAGGSRLCREDWARIVVPGSASPANTCRARLAAVLTPDEVAALPAAYQP